MQEAVSNVHILHQNLEHLNDVVRNKGHTRSRASVERMGLRLCCMLCSCVCVTPYLTACWCVLQGHEIINISAVWVGFLQQMTASA